MPLPTPVPSPPPPAIDPTLASFVVNPPADVRGAWQSIMGELLDASVAANSLSGEDSAWNFWEQHCKVWNAQPWGGAASAASRLSPELLSGQLDLAGSFIWDSYRTMRARKKGELPRPRSAYNRYYHVDRRKARHGRFCPPKQQLVMILKGMNRRHMEEHGFEALEVDRKEGYTNAEKEHLLSGLCPGGSQRSYPAVTWTRGQHVHACAC